MVTSAVLLGYQDRILALQGAAAQLRYGQMIALIVMISAFAAAGVLAFSSLARNAFPLFTALLPAPVAVYAERIRRRRNLALLETLRLQSFYERGVARLEGRWVGAGVSGEEFAQDGNHPYAKDLHVFGEGSLFELLCTCRTEVGRRHLAQSLLATPTLEEARRRQEAVRELQDNTALRERLQLLGQYSFQESTWHTIVEWLESPVVKARRWFRVTAVAVSLSITVLFVVGKVLAVGWSYVALPFGLLCVMSAALGVVYRKRVLAAQPAIRALSLELGVLRQGLALLQDQEFKAPLLRELVQTVAEANAPVHIRRLERFATWMRERDKESFYHASRALLIGTQVFLAIEVWRLKHGAGLRLWLAAWGEFEALMALATYAAEHPENACASFAEQGTVLRCEAAGHPLLASDVCVGNDIAWDETRRFYVVSGSNMAGKSTLLRAVGLNVLLAYAGGPVCAKSMTLSRLWMCASIAIQDSLLNGKSKFMAEVERLKQALSVEPEQRPVLFLIDEILSGTNSKDRRTAAEAILRALLEQGAIGAISTHDLALTELAEVEGLGGANVHMGSRDDGDPLNFDYVLKDGVTRQSSALAIARLAGVRV